MITAIKNNDMRTLQLLRTMTNSFHHDNKVVMKIMTNSIQNDKVIKNNEG